MLVKCRSNVRQIGFAFALYAEDFGGSLPYVATDEALVERRSLGGYTSNPWPFKTSGFEALDGYLGVRAGNKGPYHVFQDPADQGGMDTVNRTRTYESFFEERATSYYYRSRGLYTGKHSLGNRKSAINLNSSNAEELRNRILVGCVPLYTYKDYYDAWKPTAYKWHMDDDIATVLTADIQVHRVRIIPTASNTSLTGHEVQ
jgi:hypothetical protein